MSDDECTAMEELRKLLCEHSVRIVGLNAKQQPVNGWGNGLLWQRQDKIALLSVYHNFEGGPRWLDVGMHLDRGTPLFELGQPGTMAFLNGQVPCPTDLAWAHVDTATWRRLLPDDTPLSLPVYRDTFETPFPEYPYAFAAWIGQQLDPRAGELRLRMAYEFYMRYEGVQADGVFSGSYRFKLARNHQGHAYYKGSSGGPIADPRGKIVALVQGGCEAEGVIYGVPLNQYSRYIDL